MASLSGVASAAERNLNGIPGFLNPSTGAFQAMPAAGPASPSSTTGNRSGVYVANISIEINSPIPAKQKIQCRVNVYSYGGPTYVEESRTVLANRNGKLATCSVAIPYLWIGVDVSATGALYARFDVDAGGTFVSALGTSDYPTTSRNTSRQLPAMSPIPANGKRTVVSIPVIM